MKGNYYMATKNTILSQKDLFLLEDTVIQIGRIATSEDLKAVFSRQYQEGEINNKISQLSKQGWLVRLKRGLYVVMTDISSLGFLDLSGFVISQVLNRNSYISFENALQHYSMFDQLLFSVEAVTYKRARKYKIQNKEHRFFRIKKELYFGFTKEVVEGKVVQIAEKEKALLDMLYFRSSANTVNLVFEKLREYQDQIDFEKLKQYVKKFGVSMVREVGFLLDQLGIQAQDLRRVAKVEEGYSKMTRNSDVFNAKWRLYYDRNLTR